MAMMNKAIFLDKDGTLIENIHFNADPTKIKLYPEAPEALKALKEKGFKLIVITNQPGVAYGYFKKEAVENIKLFLAQMFERYNIPLDGFYYCPHNINGSIANYAIDCKCRKPKPGMLLKAASDLDIDLTRSWMIGDILHDVEAGTTAGCRTVLIDNGNETEWIWDERRVPTYIVNGLRNAAMKIIAHEEQHAMNQGGTKHEGKIEKTGGKF